MDPQSVRRIERRVTCSQDLTPSFTAGGPSFAVTIGATLVSFDGVRVDQPTDRIRNKARHYYMDAKLATEWNAWLIKRRSGQD